MSDPEDLKASEDKIDTATTVIAMMVSRLVRSTVETLIEDDIYEVGDLLTFLEPITSWYWCMEDERQVFRKFVALEDLFEFVKQTLDDNRDCKMIGGTFVGSFFSMYRFSERTRNMVIERFPELAV